ncbi:MAG: pyridoxal-phosphate dependent enzyme [Acidimicrobiales bacterium]|nr:pyridoxal-phosphate dependent enzyme [Acidimicrobiales bacterium]
MPTEIDLDAATARLAGVARRTPVLRSRLLDEALGAEIHLKAEHLQHTGAFKFRGAFNAIAALDSNIRARGIITYSSGNHAQAVARAAQIFRVPATVVMPNDAPSSKRQATESYGATIVTYDRFRERREDIAEAILAEQHSTLIPPFDHPDVIAGQSTCARELFEDSGPLDQLIVSVGGGGLISGSALAAHEANPKCRIVGVEPEAGNDVQLSLQEGRIVEIDVPDTVADGQQTTSPGKHTFAVMQQHVDEIVTVTDDQILDGVDYFFRFQKQVAEPSGACALAAILANKINVDGSRVGVIISGGNISPERFFELMEPRWKK